MPIYVPVTYVVGDEMEGALGTLGAPPPKTLFCFHAMSEYLQAIYLGTFVGILERNFLRISSAPTGALP